MIRLEELIAAAAVLDRLDIPKHSRLIFLGGKRLRMVRGRKLRTRKKRLLKKTLGWVHEKCNKGGEK